MKDDPPQGAGRGAPEDHVKPLVSPSESPAEFSLKAVIPGILFGIVFGSANAYLGLVSGLTISTSIPIAVMTVAAFRAMRALGRGGGLLEANISQTVGSASSSVASGVIFTLPALYLWRQDPSLLQMTVLALAGGLLGVLFMVPLRRFLIVKEHDNLPYPEGTACAGVLVASQTGGARARPVFLGLLFGGLLQLLTRGLKLFPETVKLSLGVVPKAAVAMKANAALFGVGYILGPRIASVMVGGGALSALVIIPGIAIWGEGRGTPWPPETELTIDAMDAGQIWNRYVRYIGAGAVAVAGIITLVKSIPTMIQSFRLGTQEIRARLQARQTGDGAVAPRTQRDLSWKVVLGFVTAVFLVLGLLPFGFSHVDSPVARIVAALLVVVFSFFFVTVSSRIVGLVGVTSNPTSGMTIAALLGTSAVFLACGWTDVTGQAAALTVGCVVAIAASIAGDTSQDLKTGFLLGATPARQQVGEIIGVLTSAVFVCLSLMLIADTYTFGGPDVPAPQANLMKLVIEGVLQASLPWTLVIIGGVLAVAAELARIPSLPFAVGVYLPLSTMVPVFFGGLLRWWLGRSARSPAEAEGRRDAGVLFGSGLVGGAGLVGVGIAGYAFLFDVKATQMGFGPGWAGGAAPLVSVAAFAVLVVLFVRIARRGAGAASPS